jgi:hypothetical protein
MSDYMKEGPVDTPDKAEAVDTPDKAEAVRKKKLKNRQYQKTT